MKIMRQFYKKVSVIKYESPYRGCCHKSLVEYTYYKDLLKRQTLHPGAPILIKAKLPLIKKFSGKYKVICKVCHMALSDYLL